MNLVINLKWIKWCFNNIIKVLCMAKWAIHESLLLLLKHHFIHLKLIKERKKYIFVTHFY